MKLTTRLTIRMSRDEYSVIEAFCIEQDINFSELFMESVRELIPYLPPRTYRQGGRASYARREAFHETLEFYKRSIDDR